MKSRDDQNQNQPNGPAKSAEDPIKRRAYEIYLRRGEAPGHEMEDWLQAEREVKTMGPNPAKPVQAERAVKTTAPNPAPIPTNPARSERTEKTSKAGSTLVQAR